MLDHGTHVFVWLGRDSLATQQDAPAMREACACFAAGLAAGRAPLPELRTVLEVRAYPDTLKPQTLQTHLFEQRCTCSGAGNVPAVQHHHAVRLSSLYWLCWPFVDVWLFAVFHTGY